MEIDMDADETAAPHAPPLVPLEGNKQEFVGDFDSDSDLEEDDIADGFGKIKIGGNINICQDWLEKVGWYDLMNNQRAAVVPPAKHIELVWDDYQHSDSDDDDNGCADGCRKFTKDEYMEYKKKVEETMGFDVDVPKGVVGCGIIKPYPHFALLPELSEEVKQCSTVAIKLFNEKHGTDFEFVKVVSLGCEMCCFKNYITFEAYSPKLEQFETFQAIVLSGVVIGPVPEVKFCRIKPKSY